MLPLMLRKTEDVSKTPSSQYPCAFLSRQREAREREWPGVEWIRKKGIKGTHNWLAAPVLMLRPAGPLADRANAILTNRSGRPDDPDAAALPKSQQGRTAEAVLLGILAAESQRRVTSCLSTMQVVCMVQLQFRRLSLVAAAQKMQGPLPVNHTTNGAANNAPLPASSFACHLEVQASSCGALNLQLQLQLTILCNQRQLPSPVNTHQLPGTGFVSTRPNMDIDDNDDDFYAPEETVAPAATEAPQDGPATATESAPAEAKPEGDEDLEEGEEEDEGAMDEDDSSDDVRRDLIDSIPAQANAIF